LPQGLWVWQVPAPLHDLHSPQDAPHGKAQAPAPSQLERQTSLPLPQSLFGSLPEGDGLHCPTRPGTLQAMHLAVQAFSQHTPSTQKPEAQGAEVLHVCPFLLLHPPVASQA
jgi:hypothetical protein